MEIMVAITAIAVIVAISTVTVTATATNTTIITVTVMDTAISRKTMTLVKKLSIKITHTARTRKTTKTMTSFQRVAITIRHTTTLARKRSTDIIVTAKLTGETRKTKMMTRMRMRMRRSSSPASRLMHKKRHRGRIKREEKKPIASTNSS